MKIIEIVIGAKTIFGARNGLVTISQLIERSYDKKLVTITNFEIINDNPQFQYRGFMLDTSRHYFSKEKIFKQLDAMSISKLNTFHWHITDTHSFPIRFNELSEMVSFGAYSEHEIYTIDDIILIRNYAKVRGIRIVLEIDMPSHSGNGWQAFNETEPLVVCLNEKFWRNYCIQPPCGQLNPLNPDVQVKLKSMFKELIEALGDDGLFHQGGDEVFIPCWNQTIMSLNDTSLFTKIWSDFHKETYRNYNDLAGSKNKPSILWSSDLTRPNAIEDNINKKNFIIETWVPAKDLLPIKLLQLNYSVIMATKDVWYLDHGLWGNTKYHSWRDIYNNYVYDGILGGETCMWSEFVDEHSLEPRVWPRASAIAERLWTNPNSKADSLDNPNTLVRFLQHWHRLVRYFSISCEPIVPFWCYQNDNSC